MFHVVFDTQEGSEQFSRCTRVAYPRYSLTPTYPRGVTPVSSRGVGRSLSTETIIEDEREPRRAKWRNQSRAAGTWRDAEDRRRPDRRRPDRRCGLAERRKDGRTHAGREKESERAKGKARMRNGSEKQSETYELILIGGDSGEYGLREYEGLVRLLLEVHDRLRRARVRPFHQVDPRLVLVHGVQDQLQIITTVPPAVVYDETAGIRSQINTRTR